MKRTCSLLLAAILAGTLATPAAAAATPAADDRLTQVTQAVKETLGLGDDYTSFYGELQEDSYRALWSLTWETEQQSTLRVTAGEDGAIYLYTNSTDAASTPDNSAVSTFPALSRDQARAKAQAFLDQVLTAPESADLAADTGRSAASSDSHYFNTQLLLYGLPTPIGLSVTVDAETGQITRFSRDDQYTVYTGTPVDPADLGLQGAPEQTDAYGKAQALLADTLSLRLEYVLDPDRETAVLRYLPEQGDRFYVDAQSSALSNLTEQQAQARRDMGSNTSADTTAAESGMGSGLTEAEQAGIAQMEGVLSREALDGKARTWTALKLDGDTLRQVLYNLDRETGDVTAALYYQDADATRSRIVILDGKTGDLLEVSGYVWADEDFQAVVSPSTAQRTAQDLVQALWPEQAQSCALYESEPAGAETGSAAHRFVFAQQVNGYFFPENTIQVSIDARDGAVVSLRRDFDAQPTFDTADGLISADAAASAWFDTYTTTLGYLAVPDAVQGSAAESGYGYTSHLTLAFYLEQADRMQGIDAKTGDAVPYPASADDVPSYSDLDQTWAAQDAQALAAYGIGWLGGKLEPQKALTQLDLVALLCSADNLLLDPSDPDAADALYENAYWMGLLTRADRDDGRLVTRAELVRMILDAGGYGKAAQIPGIFRCTFSDAADIPAADYGYAAIAQGLGMVTGDEQGRFLAGQTATREEAIAMLYAFMAR